MKLWQFMEAKDGGPAIWTWRVLGASGNLEATSEPHRNYGTAVTDAIRHGFLPSSDHWVVITSAGDALRARGSGARAPGAGKSSRPPES